MFIYVISMQISIHWMHGSLQEKPYLMVNRRVLPGTAGRYYGFCVDLLQTLGDMAGFDFEFEDIPGGRYGTLDQATGEWDGLVRMIMDKVFH